MLVRSVRTSFGTKETTGRSGAVAKDVVEKVGNVWKGAQALCHIPEVWKGVTSVVTPGGTQEMAVLSDQGLYFYLGRCDKPAALQYQMWIAGEYKVGTNWAETH